MGKLFNTKNTWGILSVNYAYIRISQEYLTASSNTNVPWQRLWKIKAPEIIKTLLWRINFNSLLTREILQKELALMV